jgi:acetyltransferase EpsM
MSDLFEVLVPLLNPNEPESRLSELYVANGQQVKRDAVLCTLETTKSTAELLAHRDGYVTGLKASIGDMIRAGVRLCWLADKEDWQPPEPEHVSVTHQEGVHPEGLRISEPALTLAQQANLDLSSLPIGPLVTQEIVREVIAREHEMTYELPDGPFEPNALIIYGGGGHGKSLIDLLRALGTFQIVGLIDDRLEAGSEVMGITVFGGGPLLAPFAERGLRLAVNAVGGVGDIGSRVRVFERILNAGFTCPTLVHPKATIEPSADLADGVQIFPNAYVGSEAKVSFGAIVNTSAVVSHDCRLEAYANVAPGASLAGGVTVGEGALIGMGVTINLNVEIGAGARVGNSAVVKQDVPQGAIVHAGAIWPST